MSAGRLYDKVGDKAKGKIVFVVGGTAVCRVTDDGRNEKVSEQEKEDAEIVGK